MIFIDFLGVFFQPTKFTGWFVPSKVLCPFLVCGKKVGIPPPPKPFWMARVWRDRDRDCGGELRAVANQLTGVVQLCGAGSAFAALRQVAGAFF